jgi:D-sedoheptulose 7-phosphate isomerase
MTERDHGRIADSVFAETIRLHERVRREGRAVIVQAAEAVAAALSNGRKILVFGNGGSAADAQHFAAELVGRFARERRAFPAVALTTDTSALTSISNDYGYDRVFARQVEALGQPGDVAIGISTSGRSANVLVAFAAARARGLATIALTGGDGGPVAQAADVHVNAPGPTARAQEVHRTILHVICEIVEGDLAGGTEAQGSGLKAQG